MTEVYVFLRPKFNKITNLLVQLYIFRILSAVSSGMDACGSGISLGVVDGPCNQRNIIECRPKTETFTSYIMFYREKLWQRANLRRPQSVKSVCEGKKSQVEGILGVNKDCLLSW